MIGCAGREYGRHVGRARNHLVEETVVRVRVKTGHWRAADSESHPLMYVLSDIDRRLTQGGILRQGVTLSGELGRNIRVFNCVAHVNTGKHASSQGSNL